MKIDQYLNELGDLIEGHLSEISLLEKKLSDGEYHARILGENLQAQMLSLKDLEDPQLLLQKLMDIINSSPTIVQRSYDFLEDKIVRKKLVIDGIEASLDLLLKQLEKEEQEKEDIELVKKAKAQSRGRRKIGDRPENIRKIREAMSRLHKKAEEEEEIL